MGGERPHWHKAKPLNAVMVPQLLPCLAALVCVVQTKQKRFRRTMMIPSNEIWQPLLLTVIIQGSSRLSLSGCRDEEHLMLQANRPFSNFCRSANTPRGEFHSSVGNKYTPNPLLHDLAVMICSHYCSVLSTWSCPQASAQPDAQANRCPHGRWHHLHFSEAVTHRAVITEHCEMRMSYVCMCICM